MRDPLIFNSFCFVRGSFWASGEALHGAPLAEPVNPPKSSKTRVFPHFGSKFAQKHAFFHVLASNLLKHACFSTFWRQICSKTRVFPRFWLQNASKPRVFPRFGFRIAQKRVFFNVFAFKVAQSLVFSQVLASTLFKNVHLLNFLFTNCYSGGSTQVNATEALLLPGLGLKIEGDHAPTWRYHQSL